MLSVKIHHDGDGVMFEVLNMADVLNDLPESLYLSPIVAKVETAERQAIAWTKKYDKSTKAARNKMCGYDDTTPITPITTPVPKCASKTASA